MDKEVINLIEIEEPPRPLSELLKGCRKPPKHVNLNKLPSTKSREDEMCENSKVELNFKDVLQDGDLFDIQSPVEFPSLS